MSNIKEWMQRLDFEWSPDGFLGKLRTGAFEDSGWRRFERLLSEIDIEGESALPKEFVKLLWFIPLFMSWQEERVQEKSGAMYELERAEESVESKMFRILGMP